MSDGDGRIIYTRPLAIIACGDRNWTNQVLILETLVDYDPDVVIEGNARGADKLSGIVAEDDLALFESDKAHIVMPANWREHGKAAGPIRNGEMLKRLLEYRERGWEVAVVAFHNDIENSKGTKDMVAQAKKAGVDTEIITE